MTKSLLVCDILWLHHKCLSSSNTTNNNNNHDVAGNDATANDGCGSDAWIHVQPDDDGKCEHGMAMGYGNSMSMSGMNPGTMAMQGPQMGMMDAGPVDPAKLSAVDRWRRGVGGAEG
jgi:hypothetical protein